MGDEIERKFIVDLEEYTRDINIFPSEEIFQGYLDSNNPGVEKRVRKKGDEYTFTIKDKGGLKRKEKIKKISKERFESLWELTGGRRIRKTRYYIPFFTIRKTIELDVYHDQLEDLVTAEIEFETVEEAMLKMPSVHWFAKEVTEDKRYKNRNLAEYGLPEEEEEESED